MLHLQHSIDGIIPVFVGNLKHPSVGTAIKDAPSSLSTKGSLSSHSENILDRKPLHINGANKLQVACQMTYVAWEAEN